MELRLGILIGLGLTVACATAEAQTTAIDMRRPRPVADSARDSKRQVNLNANAPLDATTIGSLLKRLDSTAAGMDVAVPAIAALLASPAPSRDAIAEVLIQVAKIPQAKVTLATDALMVLATGGESGSESNQLGDVLFTDFTASAAPDRAIASTTLVEFSHAQFTLKFLTAVAVSNAKEDGETESTEAFRTGTADLLAILQEGGNGVLRLAIPIPRRKGTAEGWRTAVAFDGGVMGDWLSVDTKSRFVVGGVFEVMRAFRATSPERVSDRPWLHAGLRAGIRYGRKGILADVDRPSLPFGQGVLEFRLPNGAVPFGLSINLVPDEFRPYTRSVHLYARASR